VPASQARIGIAVFLKALIVFLLIGVFVSLFTGLGFLFKDNDHVDSKRTLYALGVRIGFASALLLTVGYGLASGELTLNAPWLGR
jgi:Protein of unknown function (DUF2909)